ncbi:J domain-containing protein [Kineosporia babensis]|uniref:J domain-containing protein n=1 Tax=Kineosporia babensis TaxID=499548 RepID=A0A9X1NA52_9ACTN|nr:J domain-containing protein [Kineosporia babensis]MCD5311182.1 J domain-containing protein [Kineosporia babensis]
MTAANFYSVLGVAPTADQSSLRRQYRRLARALHPDHLTDPVQKMRAAAAMVKVTEAYSALHDPQRRAQHDRALLAHRPTAKDEHRQIVVRVTGALAGVMSRNPDLGFDQSMVTRILQGASEHIPEALQMVKDSISEADGRAEAAAFMALAKAFTSYGELLPEGCKPEAAYIFLIRSTAFECLKDTVWASRLTWPDLPRTRQTLAIGRETAEGEAA